MVEIRDATIDDVEDIYNLAKELADYEHMLDQVTATVDDYKKSLFEQKYARALVMRADGKTIGYALYFNSFSTFLGKGGIYLEDIYVKPEYRGQGTGTKVIKFLAQKCIDEGLGRLEWECLDWNEPSLNFYKNLGAKALKEWVRLRVAGDDLVNLAKN